MIASPPPQEWLSLLQRMLSCLRRSRDTLLQFEIDSKGIVATASADFSPGLASDAAQAAASLNALIAQFLDSDGVGDSPAAEVASLAAWLDHFYKTMRAVHPSAIDIIALRVEGFEPREIAGRLRLGLRQVQSIMREMRTSWAGELERQ